jgi:hypothetical protein
MDDYLNSLSEQIALLRAANVHTDIMGEVKALVAEAEILIEEAVRLADDYDSEA